MAMMLPTDPDVVDACILSTAYYDEAALRRRPQRRRRLPPLRRSRGPLMAKELMNVPDDVVTKRPPRDVIADALVEEQGLRRPAAEITSNYIVVAIRQAGYRIVDDDLLDALDSVNEQLGGS